MLFVVQNFSHLVAPLSHSKESDLKTSVKGRLLWQF
jgi:hypothetical protein